MIREEEFEEAIARIRKSRSFLAAEKELGFAALCIVGTATRQRRTWDDNEGVLPVRLVVTTGDPEHAPRDYNRGVHSVGGIYHTMAYVWLRSRAEAEALRECINKTLKPDPLLNGWCDVESWQMEILFGSAAAEVGAEVFDENERVKRILRKARRG